MAVLLMMYIVLFILAIFFQYLLYRSDAPNNVYLMNMSLAIFLTFIAFTSFPSNYIGRKLLAVIFGLSGASALFVKSKTNQALIPKLMLSISILGSFILLFI